MEPVSRGDFAKKHDIADYLLSLLAASARVSHYAGSQAGILADRCEIGEKESQIR
jgi:hypothetical protein